MLLSKLASLLRHRWFPAFLTRQKVPLFIELSVLCRSPSYCGNWSLTQTQTVFINEIKQFQCLLDAAHAWVKQWALLVDNNQLVHEVFARNVWCSQWRWYSWNVRIHYPFLCLFTLMCGVLMHMLWLSMASIKSNRRKMQSFVLDIGIPVMCCPLAVNHQPVWLCEGADIASRWFSLFVFSYFWG